MLQRLAATPNGCESLLSSFVLRVGVFKWAPVAWPIARQDDRASLLLGRPLIELKRRATCAPAK